MIGWRCENLSVSYITDAEPVTALRSVNLSIASGEQVAIVGPNGSGKSTLALCLAGLIQPTVGRVVAEDGPETTPYGAFVFQSPEDNLIGATVLEEMLLTLEHAAPRQANEPDARARLERYGLAALADRATAQLSGGEKQKLALACALAAGRRLIVLDEPTSHLDPPGRRGFFQYLETLGHWEETDPPTLIVVTQYPDEARRFPRVIELRNGEISYDGPGTGWAGFRSETPTRAEPGQAHAGSVIMRAVDLGQEAVPGWPLPVAPLRGITVEIRQGEIIGICGPIGSGKTTLAFHLAGLFPRWRGRLEWPGADPVHAPVVMIQFPERHLFCLTVREDVMYGPRARGVARDEATVRAHAALDLVGLPAATFGDRSPFSLSGGQQRRAALGGIAALDSSLYILDEPQVALDADGLARLVGIIDTWRGHGSACTIIAHDLDVLRALTDRVWIMDHGQIIFDGLWGDLDSHSGILARISFE